MCHCGGPEIRRLLVHVADEPEASALYRADQPLILAGIADGAARCTDPAGERILGDHATMPDGLQQLVPGDDPVMISDEVDQDVENLRFEVDRRAVASQLPALAIELAVREHISHRCASKVSPSPGLLRRC
jgi:hypothetical protein